MNIFYLDKDTVLAAQALCDKHVVKMGLEAYTMLQSAHVSMAGRRCSWMNHPCSVWARTSEQNYTWLWRHMVAIFAEYTYRYGKLHSYVINGKVKSVQEPPPGPWRESHFTHLHLGMPEVCIVSHNGLIDHIASYRQYYVLKEKTITARWTRRNRPEFLHA